jgi:hypothetical protein
MSVTGLLIRLKHRHPNIWHLVEWGNARVVNILYGAKLRRSADEALEPKHRDGYRVVPLSSDEAAQLSGFLQAQPRERMRYFNPHAFDERGCKRALANPAFRAFGIYATRGDADDKLVGYFFLRCFATRRSFVGRILDASVDGQGLGRLMNQVLYQTAWEAGFRVMTTVSRHNEMVMRSHRNNSHAKLLRELPNEYLLVEFLPEVDNRDRL